MNQNSIEITLRPWQKEALDKALDWLTIQKQNKRFLINAAPGSGKTRCASVIAKKLIELKEIDRVIVIAPRKEIVNQWVEDFEVITGRDMVKATGANREEVEDTEEDLCVTWQAVQSLRESFQKICQKNQTLVICDEHHHAAISAAWGESADSAFVNAKFSLILTGTPIRSDDKETVWFAYDDKGRIKHPEEGTYTLTYGQAVDLEYCRPTAFLKYQGFFSVALSEKEKIRIAGAEGDSDEIPKNLKRLPGIQKSLEFYTLVRIPQYEADGSPDLNSYHAKILEYGIKELVLQRERMPHAGGLVIAPTIKVAKHMAKILEILDGEKPELVHSNAMNSEDKIRRFRKSKKRWLVSVAMVSEGVDIPRLRILVYLPNAQTELAFRQALGRIVRNDDELGRQDDTSAGFIIPRHIIFEKYAERIEGEMPPHKLNNDSPTTKRCPQCRAENERSATICKECDFEFPVRPENLRKCPECGALNPQNSDSCKECGTSLNKTEFVIELDDALRQGAIIRETEYDELELQESEEISDSIRRKAQKIDDPHIAKMLRTLPDKSWSRLKHIMNDEDETGNDRDK